MPVDADAFVALARPILASGDASQLARAVGYRWSASQIAGLLSHTDPDVRRLAAVTVGLVGDRTIACRLAVALLDRDEQVVKMAEHGLWTLWFRSGSDAARESFEDGLTLLNQQRPHDAIDKFQQATQIDPHFAEAYNQCAIAHEALEQWRDGITDCRRAIQHMPCHFGAIACMGHCFAQMNDLYRALACYREAVRIHPRLLGIRAALDRLERSIGNANDHSGHFDAQTSPF